MVPTYKSSTLSNVLPHKNAKLQTQDMTSHPITVYRHMYRAVGLSFGMSHWNRLLPILRSWVRPDQEILPQPSTHISERSTSFWYGGHKLGRKYTVRNGS